MFQLPPPSKVPIPIGKSFHQHHGSKAWTFILANQPCRKCHPNPKPFLETAFGKLPPDIRVYIFRDVLTVGSLSPLKDGISVRNRMTRTAPASPERGADTKLGVVPAKPASCLALLQTCRQIYLETSLSFYALNAFHLSGPQQMHAFLQHLGPVRCDELRSLHLEDMLVPDEPVFTPDMMDFRSEGRWDDDALDSPATGRPDMVHPDTKTALRWINARGRLRKLYLHIRPSQTLEYIKLCTQLPGCERSEIAFESPSQWAVMAPSPVWNGRSWFSAFLDEGLADPDAQTPSYAAYWAGNAKYRVEVDLRGVMQSVPREKCSLGL